MGPRQKQWPQRNKPEPLIHIRQNVHRTLVMHIFSLGERKNMILLLIILILLFGFGGYRMGPGLGYYGGGGLSLILTIVLILLLLKVI
jgi:hypothetical protein